MSIYNFNYSQFTEYVKQIKYGYIDKEGISHIDCFANPDDNYLLQPINQLMKSKIGLCFDIVEMYRDYLTKKGYPNESYYLQYNDGKILETHAFIIHKKRNNLWYECIDNSWENEIIPKGYYDKEMLIKSIYDWFENYVASMHDDINKTNFFFTHYNTPIEVFKNNMSLITYCSKRDYLDTHRIEYSGMSIVFCQGKVLVLETKHNEFVFPKGHIEEGETSKDASIRECEEESGVSLINAKYYGECGNYAYTFSGGHLKIQSDDFFKTFGVNSITKNIYVHVYEIDNFQHFKLENIFVKGLWVDINKVNQVITHDNTKDLFEKALYLYKNRTLK